MGGLSRYRAAASGRPCPDLDLCVSGLRFCVFFGEGGAKWRVKETNLFLQTKVRSDDQVQYNQVQSLENYMSEWLTNAKNASEQKKKETSVSTCNAFPPLLSYVLLTLTLNLTSLWPQQRHRDGCDRARWHTRTILLHGAEQCWHLFGGSIIQHFLFLDCLLLAQPTLFRTATKRTNR